MSGKRGASDYLTKDGIGGMAGEDNSPAAKATAAQLANRKIKQMRQPRAGHRSASSALSQSSGFSSSFGGAPSNSFPPQPNGTPTMGNGAQSLSFGGFGSGTVGSGFNFGGSGAVNNPFSSGNTQSVPESNGTSPFNFNFGSSQPIAEAPAATPFQFNAQPQRPVEQSTPNLFGRSSAQQPSTMFGSTPNAFSPAPATTSAPSFGGFGAAAPAATSSPFNFSGGFGATASATETKSSGFGGFGATAPAATSSGGFGAFGATATPSQTPFGTNMFGQAAVQELAAPSPAPAFGSGFGQQTPQSTAPTFGQTNDDSMMQTSPEPSPFKPAATPFGWNKPTANGVPATPTKTTEESGEESPDRPPHVEQEEDAPKINPFAAIPRPPNPIFTPATVAPNLFSSPVKPAEPAKVPAVKTPAPEEQTEKINPFSSVQRLPASPSPSLFSSPAPAVEKAKTSSPFSFPPATSQSSSMFGQQTSSSSKPAASFNPSTSLFSAPKPAEMSASSPPPSTQPFASLARPQAPPATMPNLTQAAPAPRPPPTPPSSFSGLEQEIFREDNLPAPDPQLELTEEEVKYFYQESKLRRLNAAFSNYYATQSVNSFTFVPINNQYAAILGRIQNEKIEGRLTDLIKEYGHMEGRRKYDQELGRVPADCTVKRKSPPIGRDEDDKKAKTDGTPSSETASKFKSFLESAASPAPNASTDSATSVTPSDSSNRFANAFMQSTSSPVPMPSANPFGNAFKPAATNPTPAPTPSVNPFANAFKPGATNPSQKAAIPTSTALAVPKFGGGGPTNFMAGFAKGAKSAKELAKQKAKDDDYDSEDETEEEWEARYDKKEAEKEAALKSSQVKVNFIPGRGFISEDESGPETSNVASTLAPPPAMNSLFSSRSNSPAPSTAAGGSIFDMPRSASPNMLTPGNGGGNIFSHLSDRGSDVEGSNRNDADDEDSEAGDQQETPKTTNGISPSKRPPFTEDDDDEEEGSGLATPTPRTDGLFGRISRDSERTPLATTEANTGGLFSFTKTTSPPSNNTWTPKDPIKFANPANTSANGDKDTLKAPLFSFTPIGALKTAETPSATPSVFSGLFSGTQNTASPFGAASNPFSSLTSKVGGSTSSLFPPSGANSVFSTPAFGSRATTPGISDMSGAESTAGEAEEVTPDEQIELGGLGKDKEGHDVFWESPKVKASKYQPADPNAQEPDKKANQWVIAGVGPMAIMKNKETGVKSMLMRQTPSGNIVLNMRLNALVKPEQIKKRVKMMEVTGKGPVNWIISFQSEEESGEFVARIEEAKKS